MNYKNMSSAGRNPTRRPLHPRPAGSFQAKSKSHSVLETSSSTMCSPLSNEQKVTADFILDPPPTCRRWAWVFFGFFREWGLCASNVNSQENLYGSTSCDSSADACLQINQVTLVSSSRLPSECTVYSSSCYRLSWYATLCAYKSATITENLVPEQCKVDVGQVQSRVRLNGGELCWPWAVLCGWSELGPVM